MNLINHIHIDTCMKIHINIHINKKWTLRELDEHYYSYSYEYSYEQLYGRKYN